MKCSGLQPGQKRVSQTASAALLAPLEFPEGGRCGPGGRREALPPGCPALCCPAPGPAPARLPPPFRAPHGPARAQHGSPRARSAASPHPPALRRLLQAQHSQGAAPIHPRHPRQLYARGQRGLLPMVSVGAAALCPFVPTRRHLRRLLGPQRGLTAPRQPGPLSPLSRRCSGVWAAEQCGSRHEDNS